MSRNYYRPSSSKRTLPPVSSIYGRPLAHLHLSHLRPGGWIEIQDFGGRILSDDNTGEPDAALVRCWKLIGDAVNLWDFKYFYIANELAPFLHQAGFTNVAVKNIKTPLGTWPRVRPPALRPVASPSLTPSAEPKVDPGAQEKRLRLCGMYMQSNATDFMAAMAAKPFLRLLSEQEAEALVREATEELNDPAQHSYMNYKFWWAQKPEGPRESW